MWSSVGLIHTILNDLVEGPLSAAQVYNYWQMASAPGRVWLLSLDDPSHNVPSLQEERTNSWAIQGRLTCHQCRTSRQFLSHPRQANVPSLQEEQTIPEPSKAGRTITAGRADNSWAIQGRLTYHHCRKADNSWAIQGRLTHCRKSRQFLSHPRQVNVPSLQEEQTIPEPSKAG